MGPFHFELAWFFGIRAVEVFIVWQTISIGARFRYEIRRVGWSPRGISLLNAATWVLVVAELAGFLLYVTEVYLATYVLFAVLLLGYGRIIAAIKARTSPRILLVQEVSRIFGELGSNEGVDNRARIDEDLAALDRWVTPETFEFIQLARSRVLAWFDGGPRAADREERWSTRITRSLRSGRHHVARIVANASLIPSAAGASTTPPGWPWAAAPCSAHRPSSVDRPRSLFR